MTVSTTTARRSTLRSSDALGRSILRLAGRWRSAADGSPGPLYGHKSTISANGGTSKVAARSRQARRPAEPPRPPPGPPLHSYRLVLEQHRRLNLRARPSPPDGRKTVIRKRNCIHSASSYGVEY
jgi:hypothetical protein